MAACPVATAASPCKASAFKAMTRSTIETTTIFLGVGVAFASRYAKLPWLIWPAMALLLVGFSIRFGRHVRRDNLQRSGRRTSEPRSRGARLR